MSSMERHTTRVAVYLLLKRDNKILLMRRCNSGWRDGEYTLPAGHYDGGEAIREAMVREAREELNITVTPENLDCIHVMHQMDDSEYIDFYFTTDRWEGEIANNEPHKCDDMQWFSKDQLPENILPNVQYALNMIAANEVFSELRTG